jgi:hypothetical protein
LPLARKGWLAGRLTFCCHIRANGALSQAQSDTRNMLKFVFAFFHVLVVVFLCGLVPWATTNALANCPEHQVRRAE